VSSFRRIHTAIRNALLDLRYGSILGGTIRTRFGEVGAFHVTNSEYGDLPFLFAAAGSEPDDVFVDVGCGKGRVLNWLLTHFPNSAIYGIELDPEVGRKTALRLRRRANVQVLFGDATARLPVEGTVFYLFNPFDERVMRRFIATLGSLGPAPSGRPRRVVYYNSRFAELFRAQPDWVVREIELPSGSQPAVVVELG
jgi:SAM-dependent methyltransferase